MTAFDVSVDVGSTTWVLWAGLAAFFFVLYLGVYVWMRRPKFGEGGEPGALPSTSEPRAEQASAEQASAAQASAAQPPARLGDGRIRAARRADALVTSAADPEAVAARLFTSVLVDEGATATLRSDAETGREALLRADRRGVAVAAARLLDGLRALPRENGLRSLAEASGVAAAVLALRDAEHQAID